MRIAVLLLAFVPFLAAGESNVHIRFSIQHFDLKCEQEADVPLSETVVLCDEDHSPRHLRMSARVVEEKPNFYSVRGRIDEIDSDAKGDPILVSAPRLMVFAGQPSELSTSSDKGVDVKFKITVTPGASSHK